MSLDRNYLQTNEKYFEKDVDIMLDNLC